MALAATAALLAGCNQDSDRQAAETLIRASMASQGAIQQLELSRQPDNSYAGPLTLQRPDGQVVRLNCTARRTGTGAQGNFETTCGQVLDQALLDEIEGLLRRALEQQGATVVQVEMTRLDDDNARGFAEIRDGAGQTLRMNCAARRESNGRFNPSCDSVLGAAAPAPAAGGEEPAPAEEPAPESEQ